MRVQIHDGNPAINVKVYGMNGYVDRLVERFKCSYADAQRALEFAFEDQQEFFWKEIEELVQGILGPDVRTFSEGHSSGWLSVRGLPDIEEWDVALLSKWAELERLVATDIATRILFDTLADSIEVNEWAEPMSEKYNFVEIAGKTVCVAKVNQMVAQYRADLLEGR